MTEASGHGATRRPLRILEIETFGHGGLMHYVHNLSCALAERGHRVTLVTAAGYEMQDQPRPPGIDVRPVIGRTSQRVREWLPRPGRRLVQQAEAVVDAGLVSRLVRRIAPDIVHLHSTNQIALAYLILLRALRVPVAVTAHVVTPHERTKLQDAVRRRIHQLSPLIIAHSEHDRRRLVDEFAVDPARVVVVPHGEYGFAARGEGTPTRDEARRSFGLGPQDEAALFFGYIREYKGLDVLLDAWPAIAAARPAARLVIAGDPARLAPARRRELEAAAARVCAIHRFAYVPFSDIARYFAAADALVLPYRHVSQSGVLFLALAIGLPVVATRVGALAEVLRDGESALLVEPGSAPALSAAVTRVLGDGDLRARLADGGRRIAAECSWPSIAARTEAAFESLLLRRQPGA